MADRVAELAAIDRCPLCGPLSEGGPVSKWVAMELIRSACEVAIAAVESHNELRAEHDAATGRTTTKNKFIGEYLDSAVAKAASVAEALKAELPGEWMPMP